MGLNKELQGRRTESADRKWVREAVLGLHRTEKQDSWSETLGFGHRNQGSLRGEEAHRARKSKAELTLCGSGLWKNAVSEVSLVFLRKHDSQSYLIS